MAEIKTLIKRRKSAQNIKKITKTMALIAAAKYKVASRKVVAAKPYAESLNMLVADLMGSSQGLSHPLVDKYDKIEKTAVIIIASNRGFCGTYNARALDYAESTIKKLQQSGQELSLHIVGKKAVQYFKGFEGSKTNYIDLEDAKYDKVFELASNLIQDYLNKKIHQVKVIYTSYITATNQEPKVTTFLPFPVDEFCSDSKNSDYEVYPNPQEVLNYVVPQTINMNLYRIFLESAVSEHISRMLAMNKATDNAAEMIKDLTRLYNRARQAQITNQLSEIMGAVRSLSK